MASRRGQKRRCRGPYPVDQEEAELPWEYLYYLATVQLGWSAERFWDGSLRVLMALRDQHEKAERNRAKMVGYMTACYMNGVDPDEAVVDVKTIKAQELALGNALWY